MDFRIILLLPNGLNLGFNYYPATELYNYEEINILKYKQRREERRKQKTI